MHKVIIVGGGASGLFAAYSASKSGKQVILLEKNEKLGKKIYITGKGRCNLTNDTDVHEFLNNVTTNQKFLYGAINTFSPQDTQDFFRDCGLNLKVERGNRVFPLSDKASDVTKTLEKKLIELGVDIQLNTNVNSILLNSDGYIDGVKTDKGTIYADSVIICTGGMSYPLTGSTGDGYAFAKKLGHTVTTLYPSLVGLELCGSDYSLMQGLSLKNVSIKAVLGSKTLYTDFGEMLFTHFGVSGPIILSCSCLINKYSFDNLSLHVDLKPALNVETLNARLLREFKENSNKNICNVLRSLLPKTLIDLVLRRAKISVNKNCSQITQEERSNLIFILKNLEFKIKGLRPITEAIVTSGGVDVKQINPKTMESKIVKGLFFAGEVLDVDAFTGGFNLQIAFSTGYVAGLNA